MMNKKNNKGFTLIELIIAISIMSIVLALGYNIINKSTFFTSSQQNITNNQSVANLVNLYLSKDIEESKDISSKEEIDGNTYKYVITDNANDSIEYQVTLASKNGKKVYSLLRTYGSSSVEIVSNQMRSNEEPFIIKSNDNGTYEVSIYYNENNKAKMYSFDISSRLSVAGSGSGSESGGENEGAGGDSGNLKPNPEEIPSLPSEIGPNTHYIGFWMASPNIQKSNNVYAWIDDEYNKGSSKNNQNEIKADIRPGNNGESEFASINGTVVSGAITGQSKLEVLNIYVSKGAVVEDFEIKSGQGGSSITLANSTTGSKVNLSGGANDGKWYSCEVTGDINTFEVTSGKLSINENIVSSGYVLIVYSEAPVKLGDADIIFEYYRSYDEPMNSNQFNMTNSIKVRNSLNSYETVDSKKDNAFNGSIQTRISNYTHEGSPNILLMTEKSSDRRIYSIYGKEIKKTTKAILTLEGNISINDKSGLKEIIPDKQYEFNFPSGTNFDRHINISKLAKGETGMLKVNLIVD